MAKTTYRNAKKEKFTPISNSLLWDKDASLQAKGLLSIFLSNSNDWDLNMKEIINRSKNGRDAHYKIVNELIELGYFARLQVVDPVKRQFEEMIYVFSDVKEEVAAEIENIKEWAAVNQKDLVIEYKTIETTNIEEGPFPENQDAEIKDSANQYINNTKSNNTNLNKTNINNLYKDNTDDDKRTSPSGEGSAVHNDESINLIISNLRESTKDELTDRSFKAVVRKVVDKYNQGKVNSFRDYLATALANKIEELELRRAKDEAKEQLKASSQERIQQRKQELEKQPIRESVSFYNWLEE